MLETRQREGARATAHCSALPSRGYAGAPPALQQGYPFLLLSVVTKATATLLFLFLFSSLAAHIVFSHTRRVQCHQMRSCKQTSRTNLPLPLPFRTLSLSECPRTRSLFRCLFAHGRFFAAFSQTVLSQRSRTRSLFCHLAC